LALQALIDALQDDEAVSKHVAAAEYVAQHHSAGTVAGVVRDINSWTRAICATQPEEAYHHLSRLKLPWVKFQASIDRFECAVRAGQRDQANHWVSELEAFAAATGNAWATAASFHGRAILEDGDAAEKLFLLALEHHASSLRVVDRARTQLAFGQYLRRQRRRVDARAHLQAALETFANLGARRWEELASQELRASGKTARKRNPSTAAALTAQERQVAALVQQGMSNREVAAQLFLSPRTIDFHLRNVFAKLGITTRVELVHQRFDASPEPTPV
jgi:DNA-binding CsgD family transcriptional regulator